ncbi:MAG TPA: serine hydrolase domain-containing protein [Allosphingosinicella sp.]|nr:serine hydrolase domain-containing protein [Allosphingosinicella sp.]
MKFAFNPAVFLAAVAMAAASPAVAVPADLRQKADAYMSARWPADRPGAAVIVTEGERTVYTAGRGLADVERRTPVAAGTVFRLGSITKQFTAAIILQLVDERRISLDDPVSRFFPDYPQPGATATVRQLLNHTSGIQSYTGIPGWMTEANANRAYTTDELIAVFRDRPSPSRPGERWAYNNSGYVLLGAIVERVTGLAWHEAVARRIVRPLGLRSIRYGVGEESVPLMAHGYTSPPEGGVRPANRIHMSVPHGAGALIGSVGDLAKWARALHHGRVVSAASYALMIAPTRLPDGSTENYGFGIGTADVRGRRAIGHNGGIFGFSTDSLYLPEQDIFVAVFANSDEPVTPPGMTLRRLAAMALGDPYPDFTRVPVDTAAVEPFIGVYALPDGTGERRFYLREGRLYTRWTGGQELEVFAAGDNRYFYGPESLTWFRAARGPDGVATIDMYQNGAVTPERTRRTGPIPPEAPPVAVPRETLASYVGRYATGGPVVAIVLREDGRLTAQMGGQSPLLLKPTSQTDFEVEGVPARLVFHAENGTVTRLVIHQNGREIPATREPSPPAR